MSVPGCVLGCEAADVRPEGGLGAALSCDGNFGDVRECRVSRCQSGNYAAGPGLVHGIRSSTT